MIRPTSLPAHSLPLVAASQQRVDSQQPQDTAEVQGGQSARSQVEVDPLHAANQATLAALPGLASLPLAERLARLPVEYQVKRRFRLWFMDPNKTVKPEKAAGWMGDARLRVKTSPEASPLPLTGEADLVKLEALHGQGSTASLAQSELGEQLKQLSTRGLTFTVGGFPTDAYGAYNYLTTGWPSHEELPAPVTVRFQQLPVQRLDPGQMDLGKLEERLEKARAAAQDPVAVAQYLCEFYPRKEEITADLARFESGAQSESYASLRRVLSQHDLSKIAKGLAITTRGELGDRLGLLEDAQFYQPSYYGQRNFAHLGQAFDGLIESGLSSSEARKSCVELSNMTARDYHSRFNEVFQGLAELCPASAERIKLYGSLVPHGSATDALEICRKLSEPAGKLSETERIELFGKIPGSLEGRKLAWGLVQADLLSGKPTGEVVKRAQRLVESLGEYPQAAPAAYAAAHPERWDGVCRLLQARVPPAAIGPLLDSIAAHPERVSVLCALRERADKLGPAFLQALERESGGLEQLEKLAGSVQKARLADPQSILDDWREHPARTELAAALVERGVGEEVVPTLHTIEGWPGPSTLAQRLTALDGLHAFNRNYRGLSYHRQGLSSALSAMGALLGAGVEINAAQSRLATAQTTLVGAYNHEEVPAAFKFMAEQAANPEALDALQRLLSATGRVDSSVQCTRALIEPPQGQSQRIQAAFKLGLEGIQDQPARLALIEAVRGGESPAVLSPLVDLTRRLESDAAAFALTYTTAKPHERERFQKLLQAGFPSRVAGATLDRGGVLEPLLGLGKAGNRLQDGDVKAFQSIERAEPTSLTRLCQAFGQRPLASAPLAELFASELNGKREETEALSRLLESSRFEADQVIELYRALALPAAQSSLSERLEAFLGSGGLNSQHYQGPGRSINLAVKHAGALQAQLASGVTLKDATASLTSLWSGLSNSYTTDQAGPALEHLGSLGTSPRRELFLTLVSKGHSVDDAIHASRVVAEPAGTTSIAQRIQAFNDMQLASSSVPVRESQFRAYRSDVGAGQAHQATVTKLQNLRKALANWPDDEVQKAFDYVAEHLSGTPPELAALLAQLQAGVKPSVAVAALQRARSSGDLGRLEGLKGLGKAGHQLDDRVAAAFQEAQEQALARGVSGQAAALTLARVTAAVGARQLKGSEAALAAEYWGERLAGKVESSEIFSRLLETQQPCDTAIRLLELMEERAGATTLTQRYEAFHELGGLGRRYRGDPGYHPDFAVSFYRALAAPLQNGAGLTEVKQQLAGVWATQSYSRETLKPAMAQLGELGGHPNERALLASLITGGWEVDQAVSASRELHRELGSTSFAQRKQAFETLELGRPDEYGRKWALLEALRQEVENGGLIDRAAVELKALTAGLGEGNARAAARAWSGELLGKKELRPHFAAMVAAGVPPGVALVTVQNAPGEKLAAHSRLVARLGGYGDSLSATTARGFTDSLDQHGHADELELLAGGLAGRKLPDDPALALYNEKLAGRPEAVRAFVRLLELYPSNAGVMLADLEATGGDYARRIETLHEIGSFQQRVSWLPQAHQKLLHAAEQAGLPADEVGQSLKRNFDLQGWALSQARPLLERMLESPRDMLRWDGIFSDLLRHRESIEGCALAHQSLKDLPSEALELYPQFRASGVAPGQALELLGAIKEPVGPTSLEDRRKAFEQLCRVSSTDGRSLARRAWGKLVTLPDVSSGQLPTLASIYRKLIELGQPSTRAAELVCNIYAAEQARGVTPEELQKRLDVISEVARLEILPATGATVLRDEADRVVFSGVMVKKRRAPTS